MIKSVRKVKIIVPKESKEELLMTLQKEAIVMLPKHDENSGVIDVSNEDEVISRTNNALKKLGSYRKKNRKFFQYSTVKYENFVGGVNERLDLLNSIEEKFDQYNFLTSENKEEQKLINEVYPFKDLEYTTKELEDSLYVSFHLGYVPENRWDFFRDYSNRAGVSYVTYGTSELGHHILVYLDNDEEDKEINQLERFGFVLQELPILEEKFSQYIKKKQTIINNNNTKINEITTYFTNSTEEDNELKILADQMIAQKSRRLVIYKENDKDVIFDGWISDEFAGSLQAIVKKVTLLYQLEFQEPTEYDYVPTLLKNNKFVTPFESITNTYSVPNYREIDPNPVMSIWYWIIFGLMIGDVGYGLMMLLVFGLFTKYKKPKGEFGQLVKIFFYSGITSIIAGILYGSFFGVDFNLFGIIGNIFGQNWNSVLLDPINETMTMLIFSIGLGVLHLITALVMKVILSVKQKDVITGIADGLSWIFILLGVSMFAAASILSLLKTIGIVFLIIGIVVLIVFKGLKKKGILGKIFGGFGGLFGVTSYLSDLLSYSRILALALSSGIIAYTMNLLAGLVNGNGSNFIGIIISIPIYIGGHLFNFAMGLLSAYVHSSRLQYLEFYNKFYEGGGYLFEPLKFNTKYINEITN
ncbi:V-type ATP synthase subunit I [Haploplasma axanthum]|uniref:V-type ATP synthase subunit I n=1 Tax=Haploplasma axanthum TaxID=29552 RepID=A0A449BCI1_HAPAX|nr:V-type ATP synthase subunit I [Haploplasma axanthum]VEU80138.1 V-type ATP synthase subunit I [Haploplasma axanthum]